MWEQVFHRDKIDARGSIRKAPNAISWTMSVTKLRIAGDKDAGAIIKAWNATASRQQRIEGCNVQPLKQVLENMPSVLLVVSELGCEKCPWSDDASCSKRIFTGGAPRVCSNVWKQRLTVFDRSMRIMFQC